jgi:hypothetical protein
MASVERGAVRPAAHYSPDFSSRARGLGVSRGRLAHRREPSLAELPQQGSGPAFVQGSPRASRSGRRSQVRPSDCCRRQRAMAAWLPDSSTGGTPAVRLFGLGPGVVRGVEQAVPSKLSCTADSAWFRAPSCSRPTASTTTAAASSPPGQHVVADGKFLVHLGGPRSARPGPRSGRTAAPGAARPPAGGPWPGSGAGPAGSGRSYARRGRVGGARGGQAGATAGRPASPCRGRRRTGVRPPGGSCRSA